MNNYDQHYAWLVKFLLNYWHFNQVFCQCYLFFDCVYSLIPSFIDLINIDPELKIANPSVGGETYLTYFSNPTFTEKVFLAVWLFKPSKGSVSFNRKEMKASAFCISVCNGPFNFIFL